MRPDLRIAESNSWHSWSVSGWTSGRAGTGGPGTAAARGWGQSLARHHREQWDTTRQDTGPSDDIARHFTIKKNISERKALWPWYEWSTRSLSHLHPHSIVVQLLWAHQPPAPVLWTALAHCWDREARLFTKHPLHGKFLLLHSHGCQEVSPVILLVLIALRASVSSLVRDIRSIPNPVSHSIILSLSRQDKGGSSLENILRILIPELTINYWLSKLVKYLGYEMLDQSIERNMNCWISISNTVF